MARHDLEQMQAKFLLNQEQEKYGSHMAMRLMIEKNEFIIFLLKWKKNFKPRNWDQIRMKK